MSLINEALKKAQRQRSLQNAPISAAPSGIAAAAVATHIPAATRRSSRAPLWFGLSLLALGSLVTAVIMRFGFPTETTPTTQQPARTADSLSAPPPAITPVPPPQPHTTPVNAPFAYSPDSNTDGTTDRPSPPDSTPLPPLVTTTTAIAQAPSISSATPKPAPTPSSIGETAEASSPTLLVPPPEPAPPAPKPVFATPVAPVNSPQTVAVSPPIASPATDPHIRERLAALRITGIRGSGRDARVLINERVWRIGDVVVAEPPLTLATVHPERLIFHDTTGRAHERPL